MEPPMLPSTNSPPPPDTNAAPGTLPAPSLRWTARADWIDAEDGLVVAVRPGYDASPHGPAPASYASWPMRRHLLAAAPRMLAALEALVAVMPANAGEGDDPEQDAAWAEARAAIAKARA
jgi:hypothetical protein